jgi:hypothetical protein
MGFSISSWKKSDATVAAASNAGAEGSAMRGRAMVLVAVLGLGALGYKMFWPGSAPVKASASAKSTTTGAKPSASGVKPRPQGAGSNAARPANATAANRNNPNAMAVGVSAPDDTDVPTRTEMAHRPTGKPMPATKPAPTPMYDSLLGPVFVDESNGFQMRFPNGWGIRSFAGDPWVLDCGDGRLGLISIGFSAFPADFTADNIPPEWVARRIKKRGDTLLHSQGYAMIAGKKALWSKSTGPLPMSHASPKMTRVNYIIPLNDGRVMELRIAATPELFDQLMPTMRASVESFKLIPRPTPAK